MKKSLFFRANCKTPRPSKIALLRPFASSFLNQPTWGWSNREDRGSKAVTRKWPQNHRFFWRGEFCNWLFILMFFVAATLGASPKALILIIASDNVPIYEAFQESWRSYMHSDPEHFEAYFLKGDPSLAETVEVRGDVVWVKTKDQFPSDGPGIINKTTAALEYFFPRIQAEFDYVIRTNLSSFYVFPRLLAYLETLPKEKCYSGGFTTPGVMMASGSGMILSPDVVEILLDSKRSLYNNRHGADDQIIYRILAPRGIRLKLHDRLDLFCLEDWIGVKGNIPPKIFQFRIKSPDEKRVPDDAIVHRELFELFYQTKN